MTDPTTPLHTHKRADIVIRSQSLETPDTLCDVRTVVCTQQSILPQSSRTPGAAAERGQQLKQRDWELAALFANCTFAPLVMEDGGRLGPSLHTTLSKAISATSSTRQEQNAARTNALRLLTITNLRGVADCIRLNPWPPPASPAHNTLASFYRDPSDIELPSPLFPPRRRVGLHRSHRPPPWLHQPSAESHVFPAPFAGLPPSTQHLFQQPLTPVRQTCPVQSPGPPTVPVIPSPPRAADPAFLRPENSPCAINNPSAFFLTSQPSIRLLASLSREGAPSDQDSPAVT